MLLVVLSNESQVEYCVEEAVDVEEAEEKSPARRNGVL